MGENGWHQNYRCIDNNSMLIILVGEQGNTVIRKKITLFKTFVSRKIAKYFCEIFFTSINAIIYGEYMARI